LKKQISLKSRQKAVLWMLLWAFSFTMTMLINRRLSQSIPASNMVWARSFFILLSLCPTFYLSHLKINKNFWKVHVLRGLCLSAALFLTYSAYRLLSFHTAAILGTTGPLFTLILGRVFLKEAISLRQFFWMGLGYLGVLIVLNPFQGFDLDLNAFFSLGGNFFAALSFVMTRFLASNKESAEKTIFYSASIPFVFFSVFVLFSWKPLMWKDWGWLSLIGLWAAISQFCSFSALRQAPASFVAPFEYFRLLFLIPVSVFFFKEEISWMVVMGAFLLLFSQVALFVYPSAKS
jgi:drug/metabolite transporter (DMT)-like permease